MKRLLLLVCLGAVTGCGVTIAPHRAAFSYAPPSHFIKAPEAPEVVFVEAVPEAPLVLELTELPGEVVDPQRIGGYRIVLPRPTVSANVCATASYPGSGCSGSGTSWACAAGATFADVSSSYSSGTDGMTICLKSGSYNWNSATEITFSLSKGATIMCEVAGDCDVTSNGRLWRWAQGGGTTTKLYKIDGLDFTHSGTTQLIYTCAGGSCPPTTITSFRFSNNILRSGSFGSGFTWMYLGDTASNDYYVYGVMDGNTLICPTTCSLFQNIDDLDEDNPLASTTSLGGANNMFVEDNTITVTDYNDVGAGFVDGWAGGVVLRNNTLTNSRMLQHGVGHGWGPVNFEGYRNTGTHTASSSVDDCTRYFHHQGSGSMMFWGNTCTPRVASDHGAWPSVLHYRSTRAQLEARCDGTVGVDGNRTGELGYPCKRQPGRDINGLLYPIYSWMNKYGDDNSKADLSCEEADGSPSPATPTTCGHHIINNRDRFTAVSASAQTTNSSPFNGTTGMGFGTIANRPTTCTTATVHADDTGRSGVGYWATDEGEWDSTNGATPDGRLYICTATNTWTLWYTPYTYPHPLRSQ